MAVAFGFVVPAASGGVGDEGRAPVVVAELLAGAELTGELGRGDD